ncbi:DUF5916 domain-containing protein [candidate division KSB1 bacterium]
MMKRTSLNNVLRHYFSFTVILILFMAVQPVSELRAQQSSAGGDGNPWHREYEAARITGRPEIDGRLDDAIWQTAVFTGGFLQREPEEGAPSTEKTEFAIIYDADNLYIGARCYDSDPSGIRATEMRRDEYLWDDDYFETILDTFNDKRSAFYFNVNPNGAKSDGKTSDEGKNNNRDWDGVWECKTSVDDKGWYVELAIPWQTLRFKEGDNVEWNVNFVRVIKRKNEETYWRLMSRDFGRNGKFVMSEAGSISGFSGLKMGGRYEFLPYFSGGMADDITTEYKLDKISDMGLDMKWNATTTMTADFTYNTDFAQVEADQERVNLTRFSLFFPEKREFFLEGAEAFRFGQGGGGMFGGHGPRAGNIQLFHSRRIGISGGYQVPIFGGTRLQGKAGKYTVGLMSIQAERTILPDDSATVVPEANFTVLRLRRDVFSRASVGIMLLNKQQRGDYNRSFGFDSYIPVNDNLSFYTVGAATYSPDEPGDVSRKKNNFAGDIGLNYNSDLVEGSLSFLDIEEQFDPEMGYMQRTDLKKTSGNIEYSPRPERWGSIRQFRYQARGMYQTDHNNFLLNRQISGEFSINFENSARFSVNLEREYEYLDYDWTSHENTIKQGGYTTTSSRISYNTNRGKDISGMVNINVGDYFTGKKYGGRASVDMKAFNRFRANINYSYNWVDLPVEFHTNSLSTRISYSFNPDMFVKAYIQLIDDKLVNDDQYVVSSNILFRYIYRPGSDFYLVYNEGRMVGEGSEVIGNRTVLTKFTYFFRK